MFVREKTVKHRQGNYTYLQVVESYRAAGRVKQKVLVDFGNITHWPQERLQRLLDKLNLYLDESYVPKIEQVDPQQARGYGQFLLLDTLWRRLDLPQFFQKVLRQRRFEFEVEAALKVMVFNRLSNPKSEAALDQWARQQYIPGVDPSLIGKHHYYRALDLLCDVKEQLEQWVFARITDLLNLDLSLVFYDLTSAYFEGEGPEGLAARGYSREHRPDLKQIEIGLLVNPDGIPISHQVFKGSMPDIKALPDVLKKLRKQFRIQRVILVTDNGIINTSTIEQVEDADFEFICSAAMNRELFVHKLLDQAQPLPTEAAGAEGWKQLKDNLWIFEIKDSSSPYRHVLALNPNRRRKNIQKRRRRIAESQAYFQSFNEDTRRGRNRDNRKVETQIERWLKAKGTLKYFSYRREGVRKLRFKRNPEAIARDEAVAGIIALRTNSERLSTDEVAIGYRTLHQVEHVFELLKNFIKLRPIRHRQTVRVEGHVAVCVLACLFGQLIETTLSQSGHKMTGRRAIELMKSLHAVSFELGSRRLTKTTKLEKEHLKLIKIFNISDFSRILT